MSPLSPSSYRRRLVLGAAVALGGAALARAAGPIRLRVVTAHLPPLVVENGGSRPGALHEVLIALCRRVDQTPELEFLPWKRAILVAGIAPRTAIFPLSRVPEREAAFRWLAPLFEENYVFLAPRGRDFDVRNPAHMKDKRITLLRGAAQSTLLRELGYNNIVEGRSIDEVHRFLVHGMADAAFGEREIVRNSLRSRGQIAEFETSEPVRKTAAWLAGSRDFTEADAAMYQKAMQDMVADGSHQAILKRYGLA
ncbi:ABC transporter substrate-binding protein [Massilia sp. CF038]|uniref:substrate-binding periplasmic protein n=1 Tax=Massilia sp. CF038 TaxID=1881045 RepID=UPI00091D1F49|nr:ABC transporter substrate-binding protein [Massilia sp. CF038]SHG65418.1 amino acid ABC transporter substrate-binding protein, PAAT family [Massilia sp. CF038]